MDQWVTGIDPWPTDPFPSLIGGPTRVTVYDNRKSSFLSGCACRYFVFTYLLSCALKLNDDVDGDDDDDAITWKWLLTVKFGSRAAGAASDGRVLLQAYVRPRAYSWVLWGRQLLSRRGGSGGVCPATFGRFFGVFDGGECRHVDTDRIIHVWVSDRYISFTLATTAKVTTADAQLLQTRYHPP